MAAREDYFNASMIEQEALLKKYKLLEQSLTHALRTKEQELAKKDQELAETKALLQQAIENQNNANHPVARNGARPYRSPLDDRAGYNKENILTSALGTFGMFGMRKAAKPPPTASLPTPPTSVSGSVPSGFSTHSAAAPASDQRRAIPALRRVQSTGMFQRPQSTTGVDDLVKGFHGFGVTPSPVKSDKQDFSLMMHLSP
ncbi:hypothetical protein DFJ77DRAFT_3428 [Powellomyces hirtus]|nr:hypothetical protein DFJ77DRAFT_3428 [Powellomyces hirtus]